MKLLPISLSSLLNHDVAGIEADVAHNRSGLPGEPQIRRLRTVAVQVDGAGREWIAVTWDPVTSPGSPTDSGFCAFLRTQASATAQIRLDLKALAARGVRPFLRPSLPVRPVLIPLEPRTLSSYLITVGNEASAPANA